MTKPVRPADPDNSYQIIAEQIVALAKKDGVMGKEKKAEEKIVKNLTRDREEPQVGHISFVEECSVTDKIIVVPPLEIIKAGRKQPYTFSPIYRARAAKELLERFEANDEDHDENDPFYKWMVEQAADAIPDDKFHAYRLGEYCINQCM